MAVALTLQQYLAGRKIPYDVVMHDSTKTSSETAHECHISGDRLAKAVVVKDDEHYLMAVVPASHQIQLDELSGLLHRNVLLATEKEASALFTDCDRGAFPALGSAYGLDVIIDDSLTEQPEVYFEGGDHESLVHVKAKPFRKLMTHWQHGAFSMHG